MFGFYSVSRCCCWRRRRRRRRQRPPDFHATTRRNRRAGGSRTTEKITRGFSRATHATHGESEWGGWRLAVDKFNLYNAPAAPRILVPATHTQPSTHAARRACDIFRESAMPLKDHALHASERTTTPTTATTKVTFYVLCAYALCAPIFLTIRTRASKWSARVRTNVWRAG